MKKVNILKCIIFAVIFVLLFNSVSKVVTSPSDYRNYQWIAGFYEERENSLDAVYIGSSNCYAFWNALVGWEEYGITVYPYATSNQPFGATEYIIEEVRKTQKDPLFIINVNSAKDVWLSMECIHQLLDYMPLSMNKLKLTKHLTETKGYSWEESLEFYLPIVRYHSRWNDLNPQDFDYEVDGLKGVVNYSTYINGSKDCSDAYIISKEREEPQENVLKELGELLDYCDENQVNALFVTVPRCEQNETTVNRLNSLNDVIESRGYPTLNLLNSYEDLGLDLSIDYYDDTHTNIHGSIKFTHYLSQYLVENYGFENKKNDTAYEDWAESWESWQEMMKNYVLDWEFDAKHKDYDLERVTDLEIDADGVSASLSFSGVKDADGYIIYQKSDSVWQEIACITEEQYQCENLETGKKYTYRVVPFYEKDGERYYGKYAYKGISVEIE